MLESRKNRRGSTNKQKKKLKRKGSITKEETHQEKVYVYRFIYRSSYHMVFYDWGFIQGQAINLRGWGVNARSLTTTKQHKTIKAQQYKHPNMRGIPNW